jgi:T-complex protein 1 subunit beta
VQIGPSVLNAGAQDFKGSDAKMSIIVGAMAVSDLVKSTLGPKGMVNNKSEFKFNFKLH